MKVSSAIEKILGSYTGATKPTSPAQERYLREALKRLVKAKINNQPI